MFKQDLIVNQIEQIGKILIGIVLSLSESTKNLLQENINNANIIFKEKLDIDIDFVLSNSQNKVKKHLEKRLLTENHFEQMSVYFVQIAKNKQTNKKDKLKYLKKSLELFTIANEIYETVSFDRFTKINEINILIEELENL